MRIVLDAAQLQGTFVRDIESISGQPLMDCYQCGRCSAGCPVVDAMDLLPNQVIRLAQLGLQEVLSSSAPWVCASPTLPLYCVLEPKRTTCVWISSAPMARRWVSAVRTCAGVSRP